MGNRQTNLFDIPDSNLPQVCNYYAEHYDGMTQFLSYVKNCSVSFKGYDSNSASPSDIIELTDSKGNKMVMKYFLVNGSLTTPINMTSVSGTIYDPPGEDFHFRVPNQQYETKISQTEFRYQPQVYELQVYKDKVRPLVKFNVCPYFIDFYGGNLDVTFDQMLEFVTTLNRKVFLSQAGDPTPAEAKSLDRLIEMRLKRNSYLIANPDKYKNLNVQRVSIISEAEINGYASRTIPSYSGVKSVLPMINQYYKKPEGFLNQNFLLTKDFKNARYGYIISKRESSVTFKSFLSSPLVTNEMMMAVVFQICIAHYALYLSGVAHNDAHWSNIFIKDLGSVQHFTYFIDGDRYEFQSRYIPLLYDFDRSYQQGIDNLGLRNTGYFSQINNLINGKDFMKSVCYIFRKRNTTMEHYNFNNNLTSLLTKGNNQQYINDLGTAQSCFFEGTKDGNDNKINNPAFYNNRFYTYQEMIKRMGGEMKLGNDFGFHLNINSELKEGTNCYYLYSDFFRSGTIDSKIIYETVRNIQKNISIAMAQQYILAFQPEIKIDQKGGGSAATTYGASNQEDLNLPVDDTPALGDRKASSSATPYGMVKPIRRQIESSFTTPSEVLLLDLPSALVDRKASSERRQIGNRATLLSQLQSRVQPPVLNTPPQPTERIESSKGGSQTIGESRPPSSSPMPSFEELRNIQNYN